MAARGGSESDRKTKIFPVMNREFDVGDQFSEKPRFGMGSFLFFGFICEMVRKKKKRVKKGSLRFFEMRKQKMDRRYS